MSRNFVCSKCEETDIHVAYRAKGERLDQCFGDPVYEAKHECLRCYCRRCGYHWSEQTSLGNEKGVLPKGGKK